MGGKKIFFPPKNVMWIYLVASHSMKCGVSRIFNIRMQLKFIRHALSWKESWQVMSINCAAAAAARGDSKSGVGALGGVALMLLSEGWTAEDGFGGEGRRKGDFKPGHWLVEMRGRLCVLAVTFGPDICLPLNNTLDSGKEWWPGPGWHCTSAKVTDSRPLPLPLSLVNTHPGHWWAFLWITALTLVCLHLHLQFHLKYPLRAHSQQHLTSWQKRTHSTATHSVLHSPNTVCCIMLL